MNNEHKNNLLETGKIAIIAGDGKLPVLVVQELLKNGQDFIVLCFDKQNEVFFKSNLDTKHLVFLVDFKKIAEVLVILKKNSINAVVCCGGVIFPGIRNIGLLKPSVLMSNFRLIKYFIKAFLSKQKGDDFLLTLVECILNKIHCKVIAVQDVLPNLLCTKNDEVNGEFAYKYQKDIEYGAKILDTLSEYDIGQSIVIYDGRILGVEGAEGTQELIKRCGTYFLEKLNLEKPDTNKSKKDYKKRPVLVKKSKINQNKKLDIPTIGEQTIVNLVENGFAGLAIETNGVFMLDKDKILNFIKQRNFFIKLM